MTLSNYKQIKNITDSNISVIEVELQKTKNKRTYMSVQRMIYSEPVPELLTQF